MPCRANPCSPATWSCTTCARAGPPCTRTPRRPCACSIPSTAPAPAAEPPPTDRKAQRGQARDETETPKPAFASKPPMTTVATRRCNDQFIGAGLILAGVLVALGGANLAFLVLVGAA